MRFLAGLVFAALVVCSGPFCMADDKESKPKKGSTKKRVIELPKNVPGWVSGDVKNLKDIEFEIPDGEGTGGKGTGGKGTGGKGTGGDGEDEANPEELDDETRLLAAVAYGEGSAKNIENEMAGIANVLVRQQKARGYSSITEFMQKDKTFAFAAHDGNRRFKELMDASVESIEGDPGMSAALRGARNALSDSSTDYSNGAYFWDGADIKTNYEKHVKIRKGVRFTDASHDIYGIGSNKVPGEEWWRDQNGNKTKLRGKWDYTYDSTAAEGGTIFWKYNDDFRKATGNAKHK